MASPAPEDDALVRPSGTARRTPPILAGVAVIVGLVAAGAGGLAVLERGTPTPPAPPSVTVTLPERPEAAAPPPVPVERAAENVGAPDDQAAPPPQIDVAMPEPAPVPGLALALGGLAWNEGLADVAHRAMPAEIAFTVAVDHPELSEQIGAWRDLGRDVLLLAPPDADVDALLVRHPGAAGVVVDGRRLAPRRGPDGLVVRGLDASLMDYAGFAAALREVTRDARALPPPVLVIELYPGLVPQLQAWFDQLQGAGYRLWRPLELGEAMGE